MKKYLFTTLVLLGWTLAAVAQISGNRVWYNAYVDKEHQHYHTHYIMDRKAMEFHFDWDSDNEMLMKNYKKSGNTETFDAYYKENPNKLFAHITLVIDSSKPVNSNITVKIVEYASNPEHYYLEEDNSELGGKAGGSPVDVSGGNAKGSVKNGAKNLLNKGKNLFKKKK